MPGEMPRHRQYASALGRAGVAHLDQKVPLDQVGRCRHQQRVAIAEVQYNTCRLTSAASARSVTETAVVPPCSTSRTAAAISTARERTTRRSGRVRTP
jgi:hypothetical protein